MYSKYIDNSQKPNNTFFSMEEILENILDFPNWIDVKIDPVTEQPLKYEVQKGYEEDQKITIHDTEFSYNYIKYAYDVLITSQETNPISVERLRTVSGTIILYSDGNRTQYLVDRARGGTALRILRVISNAEKNKIIAAQPFDFSEDFFIWLIAKFMNDDKVIDEEESIVISRIIGFKGEGSQKQAVLSGSGNEVMNLLSSLSFLIEMDVMTEIEVRIEHESETFEFRFFSKNSQIDVLLDNYSGQYMMEINEIKNPKILLSSFIDIIPSIINGYSEDIQNKEWTKDSKRKFILGLVDSVKEKLEGLYPSEEQQELNAIK
ncbi:MULTISPECIES: hypothetical protein [Enterococcus]|uniref:hypothetical protein n=1 Tax=Enterococcus TaxID=1350 RepID=UPI0001CEBD21|nr:MULTISPECIES: hypothetical protein [Enterococcus]EFF31944.1 conserved hypothetical protein [Enterococcus faecium E1039]EME8062649.1 hypothetical protein [Enterococcus faecium]EME8171093.1 hypothetical protein [Enterococcus faecium]EMF0330887.1 hypothetical protein [Enterococcus faecium]EOH38827.1 hypothetical protein SQW_01093 [Enterococcus faecium EnGen0185]